LIDEKEALMASIRPSQTARILSLSIFLSALAAAPGARGADSDSVTGSMTVAGKTYKLTHVSARRQPDLADKSKMVVVVLLTDNEVPKSVLDDRYRLELTDLAREGKIHGVSVTLGTDKQPSGTGFTYAKELGGAIVNRPDQHTFEPVLFADTRVEGKLSGKGSFGDDKWDYTAAFKSSVSTLK
jgi:hypothetical protein